MKSGMQMMLEGMLGADGVKAVEDCKRILPAVPQLIESIKREWEASKERQELTLRLLERISTQNNLIVGKLENLEFKVDPNKVTETPPTLMHHLSVPENAERFATDGVNSNGNNHD